MPRGRPRKYKTAAEMQERIDKYFADCDEQGRPYTVTGLALALDMSREDLLNYQGREEFFDTVRRAKQKCEQYAEEMLYKARNPHGVIFSLKNNWGWRDRFEQEISGPDGGPIGVVVLPVADLGK